MAEWLRDVSVGDWYEAGGDPFEIVGIDAQAEVVLIQHFDGSLEDIEFDTWLELAARPCAPPEDYSGALDIEPADYDFSADDAMAPSLPGGPLGAFTLRLDHS
jgi:hypothetical protein